MQSRLVRYADLSRLYSVLNYLSNIPWKINQNVLKIVEGVWEEGGTFGEIPKRYSEMINTYVTKYKQEKDYKKQR